MCCALCLPDTWSAGCFAELYSGGAAGRALESAESSGLVERWYEGDQEILSLPTAVRSVLCDMYVRAYPDGAREFHRALARWFLKHGEVERSYLLAFQHAVDGEDWPAVEAIWSKQGANLLALSSKEIADSLPDIPEDLLARYPSMRVSRRIADVVAGYPRHWALTALRGYFESNVRSYWETTGLSVDEVLRTGSFQLIGLRFLGRFDEFDELADTLRGRVDSAGRSEISSSDEFGWFCYQVGLMETLRGASTVVVSWYRRSWQICDATGSEWFSAAAAANLALMYTRWGEPAQARGWLEVHAGYRSIPVRGATTSALVRPLPRSSWILTTWTPKAPASGSTHWTTSFRGTSGRS